MAEKNPEKATPKKEEESMMASEETYMTSGAHIGTRQKTADIKEFISSSEQFDDITLVGIEKN